MRRVSGRSAGAAGQASAGGCWHWLAVRRGGRRELRRSARSPGACSRRARCARGASIAEGLASGLPRAKTVARRGDSVLDLVVGVEDVPARGDLHRGPGCVPLLAVLAPGRCTDRIHRWAASAACAVGKLLATAVCACQSGNLRRPLSLRRRSRFGRSRCLRPVLLRRAAGGPQQRALGLTIRRPRWRGWEDRTGACRDTEPVEFLSELRGLPCNALRDAPGLVTLPPEKLHALQQGFGVRPSAR
mmetsp:Transcript_48293/g.154215  ORF Transcript_48293/g.154215 Transcript_48293/m.154215 type:complete len:245 (+) Transcript_48293:242-976(+)